MQKVIQLLVDECNMGTNSHFVDLGGGQGRPSFHCATTVDVRTVTSIEIALTRHGVAMNGWATLMEKSSLYNNVMFLNADVTSFDNL